MASSSNTGYSSDRRRNAPPEIKVLPRDKVTKKPYRKSPNTPLHDEARYEQQDVSDYSDTERSARTAALMAMHGDEINDYGSAIHTELLRQINAGKYKDASAMIRTHLNNIEWHEPPISPLWTDSSGATPSSASSSTRRNRFVGRELRNREFKFLLEQDRKFHALMNDLSGLREWWASNRIEWNNRREKVYDLHQDLSATAFRNENAPSRTNHTSVEQRKYFGLKSELVTSELNWFPQNKRLQRKVKAQFKLIKRKTAMLEGRVFPSNVVKEWKPVEGFKFKLSDSVTSIAKLPWYHNYGFTWWLANIGADHLQFSLNRCKAQFIDYRNRLEDCEVTMAFTRKEISEIEKQAEADDRVRSFGIEEHRGNGQKLMNLGKSAKKLYDKITFKNKRLIAEKGDLLLVLDEERRRLSFDLLDLRRRQERQKALLALVQALLTLQNFDDLSMDFANNLYFTLAFHYQFEQSRNKVAKFYQSTDSLRSDRLKLLSLLDDHYRQYDLHHQELINKTQDTIDKIKSGEKIDAEWAQRLYFNMKEELDSMTQIAEASISFQQHLKKRLKLPNTIDMGPIVRRSPPTIPATWANITTMKQAMEVLNARMQVQKTPLGHKSVFEALRSFFLSPDIAPTFRDIDNISKPTFLRLVNDFLEAKISSRQLEAFLFHCNEVGDLFTVNMAGRVSGFDQGWELAHEMPIDGPTRRAEKHVPRPSLSDDFLKWLHEHQDAFLELDRKIPESTLINFMRNRYPPFQRIGTQGIKLHLFYFHHSGLRYQYTNDTTASGTPILLRIDNGWYHPRDSYSRYDSAIVTPVPWFKNLRALMIKAHLRARYGDQEVTEEILYKLLQPSFDKYIKGFFGWRKVVMTRHRFHLFLRWCDQNVEFVRMRRCERHGEGPVEFIDHDRKGTRKIE